MQATLYSSLLAWFRNGSLDRIDRLSNGWSVEGTRNPLSFFLLFYSYRLRDSVNLRILTREQIIQFWPGCVYWFVILNKSEQMLKVSAYASRSRRIEARWGCSRRWHSRINSFDVPCEYKTIGELYDAKWDILRYKRIPNRLAIGYWSVLLALFRVLSLCSLLEDY